MVFWPTFSVMAPDAEPLVTVVPFTVTVAVGSVAVGVTVIELVALATVAV